MQKSAEVPMQKKRAEWIIVVEENNRMRKRCANPAPYFLNGRPAISGKLSHRKSGLVFLTFIFLLTWIGASRVQASEPPPDSDAKTMAELEKLERTWIETGDTEVLSRIVAEDFTYIDADANVLNRQQYLKTVSRLHITDSELKDLKTRIYGDIAIVTNTWSGTYTFDGKETTETLRYTDVFIRRNGAWQAINSQATRVPKH